MHMPAPVARQEGHGTPSSRPVRISSDGAPQGLSTATPFGVLQPVDLVDPEPPITPIIGIVAIAHPGQRVEAQHVEDAVLQGNRRAYGRRRPRRRRRNSPRPRQLHDLRQLAFQVAGAATTREQAMVSHSARSIPPARTHRFPSAQGPRSGSSRPSSRIRRRSRRRRRCRGYWRRCPWCRPDPLGGGRGEHDLRRHVGHRVEEAE
jgi:hypothetical protein